MPYPIIRAQQRLQLCSSAVLLGTWILEAVCAAWVCWLVTHTSKPHSRRMKTRRMVQSSNRQTPPFIVSKSHAAVRTYIGWDIPGIANFRTLLFFAARAAAGMRHVAPGARDIVEKGQGTSEARQEGTTVGECSTYTPP